MTYSQKHYRKRKADPVRHRRYLDWCKSKEARNRAAIVADPSKHSERKKWVRDYEKKRRAYLRKYDPIGYEKLLLRDRKKSALRRKLPKVRSYLSAYNKLYLKKRRKEDPLFRVIAAMRCRIVYALSGKAKQDRSMALLGCSPAQLKAHLEIQFQSGMSWENYGHGKGKWTVDHLKPCAAFDLSLDFEQKECFHFSNLRPMWFEENISKNSLFNGIMIRRKAA